MSTQKIEKTALLMLGENFRKLKAMQFYQNPKYLSKVFHTRERIQANNIFIILNTRLISDNGNPIIINCQDLAIQ
ncbi:hypothetical protein FGO68_gene2023 [Halteria grandinella]|uniref:Uncharacterized protein n=1 Tax=Halteria grandinella TaxID=5974 RepID=A0A8J8T2G9_HALGN|nr:hypothetical protein FGO68_gene2023 [Halteria grandinella]